MFAIESIKEVWDSVLSSVLSAIPEEYHFLVHLGIYAILIAIYSIFIWKFYRFIAKRDIVDIDLWKYIQMEESAFKKFFASFFYLVEYIILLPFVVLFWYAVLCLFFLLLAREQTISNILLIGMAVVAAIRITAYYNEDLSKDIAKMLPLTLLAVFIMTPGFFSFEGFGERIMEIPSFLQKVLYYIIFVVALEFIMRIFATIKQLFTSPSDTSPSDIETAESETKE